MEPATHDSSQRESGKGVQTAVRKVRLSPGMIVANLLVIAIVVVAGVLESELSDFYRRSVQEDETLEWATFWAFVLASFGFVVAGVKWRSRTGRLPWFLGGLGLFCLFVALEEISWGQRLLGYQPPEYFLAENYQQELNVHNVIDTKIRKLTLKVVILGYGVMLPMLAAAPLVGRAMGRVGVVSPPWQLTPAFFATFLLYELYPWSHTGEWVELMLGLCFLCVALVQSSGTSHVERSRGMPSVFDVVTVWLVVLSLGFATAGVSRAGHGNQAERVGMAEIEAAALREDFLGGEVRSRCSLHKRLYTFVEEYGQEGLREGAFAGLVVQGLPEARAEFFLDPWNSPYWLRDRCENGRRVTFVYSFGPNRRRESSRWETLGDDVGAYIRQ